MTVVDVPLCKDGVKRNSSVFGQWVNCGPEKKGAESSRMSIRILIAEAREIVRRGISEICTKSGMEVVGEVTRADELASATQALQPQVLVADPRLPGGDCLEVMERLKLEIPSIRIVILSDDESATLVGRSRGTVSYTHLDVYKRQGTTFES